MDHIAAAQKHHLAASTLPSFITAPGQTDYLLFGMALLLIVFTFALGLLYWRLHALPEHIAHGSKKVQFEIVCVLALLAMFTHNHLFWIAGLLLAFIDLPDFAKPLGRVADSMEHLASKRTTRTPHNVTDTEVISISRSSSP